jgi:hypothetical protein
MLAKIVNWKKKFNVVISGGRGLIAVAAVRRTRHEAQEEAKVPRPGSSETDAGESDEDVSGVSGGGSRSASSPCSRTSFPHPGRSNLVRQHDNPEKLPDRCRRGVQRKDGNARSEVLSSRSF